MPNDMKCYFDSVKNTITSWGNSIIDGYPCPEDFSFDKYVYIPNEDNTFNEDGIQLKPVVVDTTQKRQNNIKAMKTYMKGQVSAYYYDMFLNDTASHQLAYIDEGTRLETWIETTTRNDYNATGSGFKTRSYGNSERSEHILSILSDL
jgi:hypothetical protein